MIYFDASWSDYLTIREAGCPPPTEFNHMGSEFGTPRKNNNL